MNQASKANTIVLIGMPGAGKSTIGTLLAQRLGRLFIDTDRLIEANADDELANLLARHGAEGFRALEAAALREAQALAEEAAGAVIATGGSAVYCAAEMQALHACARIVHLEVDLPTLEARAGDLIRRGVVRRPGQSLAEVFAEREALYHRYAHVTYRCGGMGVDEMCGVVLSAVA
ncbi:MAG TPA: shikimate kinase [Rhodocyclaceae bacterium]